MHMQTRCLCLSKQMNTENEFICNFRYNIETPLIFATNRSQLNASPPQILVLNQKGSGKNTTTFWIPLSVTNYVPHQALKVKILVWHLRRQRLSKHRQAFLSLGIIDPNMTVVRIIKLLSLRSVLQLCRCTTLPLICIISSLDHQYPCTIHGSQGWHGGFQYGQYSH